MKFIIIIIIICFVQSSTFANKIIALDSVTLCFISLR